MTDKPTRRSFFGFAAAAPVAAAVLSSDLHAADARRLAPAPAKRAIRTAVSVYADSHFVRGLMDVDEVESAYEAIRDSKYQREHSSAVVAPEGFIPVAVGVGAKTEYDLHIVVFDTKRVILDVSADALARGPLDFWYEPEGDVSVFAYFWGNMSCYPDVVPITIFGEIDID